jgi:hypothetical protein
MGSSSQRPALGVLFTGLALGFAGVAVGAAWGAGGDPGRWIVAAAGAALGAWLASLAWSLLRPDRRRT